MVKKENLKPIDILNEYLEKKGVSKIFGPGTIVSEAAIDLLNTLLKKVYLRLID